MIPHTAAFKALKDQSQEIMDFAILVSYSVPFLTHKLKERERTQQGDYNKAQMEFRPDTFDGRGVSVGKIRGSVAQYRKEIAKMIRLSSFSYFEAYFGEVLDEIVKFHHYGALPKSLKAPIDETALTVDQRSALKKLREPPAKGKDDKYKKALAQLQGVDIAFPHYTLVGLGLERMEQRAKSYKAVEIPTLLSELLGLQLSEGDVAQFTNVRDARNRIAHGNPLENDMRLKSALKDNGFLRGLALKIDEHVLSSWMVIDPIIHPLAST